MSDATLKRIEQKLDNHIEHIANDIAGIKKDVAGVKKDLADLRPKIESTHRLVSDLFDTLTEGRPTTKP